MNEPEIYTLTSKDEQKWDDFVRKCNGASFYHLTGWKHVVEDTYGHQAYYFFTKSETGEITGILPLIFIKSRIFGNKLLSLPYAPYGGICCDNQDSADALLQNAIKVAQELSAPHLEIRGVNTPHAPSDFGIMEGYFTFLLDISDIDSLWKNLAPSVKRKIKKASGNTLIFKSRSDPESSDAFYTLYEDTMKKLGTPAHSIRFFNNIMKTFPRNISINTIEFDEKTIASLFLIQFKDTVISAWGMSLSEYVKYAPNNLIYWNSIKESCESGYHTFDFGRSLENSGSFNFKKYWGTQQIPLTYLYYPGNLNLKPPQEAYHTYAKIWNVIPQSVTRIIGPSLRKYIP
jgi:FemAB-related protein (PEP-CTERM system-associated)